jgi:hypothetical protein
MRRVLSEGAHQLEKEDIDKIRKIRTEMDKVSNELTEKVSSIDGDVITIRSNAEVKEIWNRLCRLHMKAVVSCEYDGSDNDEMAKLCEEVLQPRACIDALHLSEEETCCGRFLKRIKKTRQ